MNFLYPFILSFPQSSLSSLLHSLLTFSPAIPLFLPLYFFHFYICWIFPLLHHFFSQFFFPLWHPPPSFHFLSLPSFSPLFLINSCFPFSSHFFSPVYSLFSIVSYNLNSSHLYVLFPRLICPLPPPSPPLHFLHSSQKHNSRLFSK